MRIHEIQSGTDRSVTADLVRFGLWLGEFPYRWAVRRRNRGYDERSKTIVGVDVPVICVGNLTTGGTGKTPVVCHLATWFQQRNHRVCLISRGYGRLRGNRNHPTNEPALTRPNDEAMELAQRLPGVPHVQNPDRVQAARDAVAQHGAQVILMDDGFQHRRLHRDMDIVVIDATCPFGHGHLLPRGLLREPVEGLARASAVILTRCDLVCPPDLAQIESEIKQHVDPHVPVLRASHQASGLLAYPDQWLSLESLGGKRVVTVCGIGNPAAFEQTVASWGASVIDSIRFPDHDPLGEPAIRRIEQIAKDRHDQFNGFVCTHKDMVKLRCDQIAGKPIQALQIELRFVTSGQPLYQALERLLPTAHEDSSSIDDGE